MRSIVTSCPVAGDCESPPDLALQMQSFCRCRARSDGDSTVSSSQTILRDLPSVRDSTISSSQTYLRDLPSAIAASRRRTIARTRHYSATGLIVPTGQRVDNGRTVRSGRGYGMMCPVMSDDTFENYSPSGRASRSARPSASGHFRRVALRRDVRLICSRAGVVARCWVGWIVGGLVIL